MSSAVILSSARPQLSLNQRSIVKLGSVRPQVILGGRVSITISTAGSGPQGIPGPPYTPYNFIRKTDDPGFTYYGFSSGTAWRIKRKSTARIWTVANGSGDFDAAWADRANKVYGYN